MRVLLGLLFAASLMLAGCGGNNSIVGVWEGDFMVEFTRAGSVRTESETHNYRITGNVIEIQAADRWVNSGFVFHDGVVYFLGERFDRVVGQAGRSLSNAVSKRDISNEAMGILASIANMQHIRNVETGRWVDASANDVQSWQQLGFREPPRSDFWDFRVELCENTGFLATATLTQNLFGVRARSYFSIDAHDIRRTSNPALHNFNPSWRNVE